MNIYLHSTNTKQIDLATEWKPMSGLADRSFIVRYGSEMRKFDFADFLDAVEFYNSLP